MDTIDFNKHDIDIFINERWQQWFVIPDIVTNRAMNDDYKNMPLSIHIVAF